MLDQEPGKFLFAALHNISILLWLARADAPGMARLAKATAKLATEYPKGRSSVTVIGPRVPLPSDEETQTRLIEILRRSAGNLACLAILADGKGFERSVRLSFYTKMQLASAGSYDMSLFDDIDELQRWVAKRHLKTGIAVDPATLGDAVRHAMTAANMG